MSDSRKGKFALSGLGKGSSSGAFRSFRFSPENEEIEEIMLQDPTAEDKTQSQPDSPKPSGGDVSPLKEILKHKLANKLEKRSLSFDLDLKGKLINVFEDKRKSLVSHFIPEETGIIPPVTSIAEHIGYAGDGDTTNGITAKNTSESNEVYMDLTGDFEEVGTDYLANSNLQEETHLEQVLKFNVSPEYLQEYFGGYSPVYYHHPRLYSELPLSDSITEISNEDLKPVNILKNILSALGNHEWTKYLVCLIGVALFLPFGAVFISPILWIVVGGTAVVIFQESLLSSHTETSARSNDKTKVVKSEISGAHSSPPVPSVSASMQSIEVAKSLTGFNFHSQGWMTEFEGEYDALTCNVRLPRIVFVRIEGSMLYISYPHPKHRIPKRRLWNDPQITVEHTFLKHCVYNILGATVSIAPERLARKRAWNKKYPIAVRLPSHSVMAVVSPSSSNDLLGNTDLNSGEESTEKKVTEPKKEITREDCSLKTLYLFSRTDREKDDWFRRLIAAAKSNSSTPGTPDSRPTSTVPQEPLHDYLEYMRKIIPSVSNDNSETLATPTKRSDKKDKTSDAKKDTIKKDASDKSESSSTSSKLEDSPASSRKGSPVMEDSVGLEKIFTVPQSPAFLNAFLGRIFYDFLRNPYWKLQVNDMIQKKLNYIRRPQFLETLIVRDLDLGTTIPIIQRASNPVLDSQGLWIDLDLSYDGNIVVTLETKINLLKLRKSPSQETPDDSPQSQSNSNNHSSSSATHSTSVNFSNTTDASSVSIKKSSTTSLPGAVNAEMSGSTSTLTGSASNSSTPLHALAHMFDSDADDSGESSEDEVNPCDFFTQQGSDSGSKDDAQNSSESGGTSSKGKKILKMAEKIASSKYVQHATEMKVVKKAIANVANTPIVLAVELKSLNGTLALNIAPPPSDRLWMGFRHNPSMQISAKPKFGARAVNLTHVTDWIQKKLLHEFQRVIVFPNMNDVTIPLMEFKLPK